MPTNAFLGKFRLPVSAETGTLYARNRTSWQAMRPLDFFARHPVFRLEEFRAAYRPSGPKEGAPQNPATIHSILKQHVAAGNLVRIRRGLYATAQAGRRATAGDSLPAATGTTTHADPFLVASRLTDDAVVAFHSALELLGVAHSTTSQITYLTGSRRRPFEYQGTRYVSVLFPASLRDRADRGGGLREEIRQGLQIQVTGYERTLVDVLDAPQYGGGWEEIWRSLQTIPYVDLDFVVEYTRLLGSALTAARVGFYLEQHRDSLLVEDKHLAALHALSPTQATYLDRDRKKGGTLQPRWNLIVPDAVLGQTWRQDS